MDTGKDVHVQDGEEYVDFNSMAASEINRDVGFEKHGEESEEGTRPAAAIGAAAIGASYLHPVVLEESESDYEDPIWINHPSSSPEGSLLHAVYLQLLGAGFDDLTVPEPFRSRVHTWRKASEKPAAAAALAELEMEFEEMPHRSMGDVQMPSRVGNKDDDSNGEQVQIPMESVSRRPHVAAKKIVAKVGSFKLQPIRARTTRPLPLHIAARRKTPVKKNKGI